MQFFILFSNKLELSKILLLIYFILVLSSFLKILAVSQRVRIAAEYQSYINNVVQAINVFLKCEIISLGYKHVPQILKANLRRSTT